MSRWKSVTNALANVCRGSANALVMVVLPYFLTRHLSKDVYGTWFLILQIATYISFLDFGVQTAIGRFVAYHNELKNFRQRDEIVSTSIAILSVLSILGLSILLLVSLNFHYLFREMPIFLESDAKISLLILGSSLAIALPFSVFGALFIGIQRYDVPAWIIGVNRILGGAAVIFASRQNSNQLITMALAMGTFNISSAILQYAAYRRMLTPMQIKLSLSNLSLQAVRDVFEHCSSFVIWTLSLVLVTHVDILIIGYFDYKSVPYYSLASILISFIVGVQGSIFSTILPSAAAISTKQDGLLLGNLLLSTTRYAVAILVITAAPLIMHGHAILTIWAGRGYAEKTILLLHLLVIANFIRQLGGPYSMIVMAVGEQGKILLSPVIEGVTNFLFSVLLTFYFGLPGVAFGTLIGAIISVTWHFMYNLPRTKSIMLREKKEILRSSLYPMIAILPSFLYLSIHGNLDFSEMTFVHIISTMFTISCTFVLLYFFALSKNERYLLVSTFRNKLNSRNKPR